MSTQIWKNNGMKTCISFCYYEHFMLFRISYCVSVWFYFSLCMKKLCPINEGMRLLRINEALRISLFRNYQLGHCSSHITVTKNVYWLSLKTFFDFFLKYCITFCLSWINKVLSSHRPYFIEQTCLNFKMNLICSWIVSYRQAFLVAL